MRPLPGSIAVWASYWDTLIRKLVSTNTLSESGRQDRVSFVSGKVSCIMKKREITSYKTFNDDQRRPLWLIRILVLFLPMLKL